MKILVRLVLIAIVGAGLWYAVNSLQAKKQAELAAFANAPRPLATVAAETVTLERWKQFIPTIGALKAVQEVMVTTEVDGKITAIHFESGDYVEAGKKLIELDSSVAEAQLHGLVAAQKFRQLEFERANTLWKDKTVSKSDLDIAAARRDETAALVLAQRASIAQKVIRAPFSGRLGIRAIDKGQYLEPGMKIVSLRALDPIYVDFAVPERFFSNMAIGQTISFTVQAFPDHLYNGTVHAIEPGIESSTRNIRVRAQSTNPNEELRPGMFAEISLAVGKDEEVLSISETAIDYTPYGNSVFIIEPGDGGLQVQRVQIETGGVRDGRIEVLNGLEVGQQIVALGHNKLRNGMRVKLDEEVPLGITR